MHLYFIQQLLQMFRITMSIDRQQDLTFTVTVLEEKK